MNKKRFIGFALILVGILMSLSRIVMIGAVIGEAQASSLGIIGALIVIVGLILIIAAEKEEGGLERKIIRTDRFEKSTRRYQHMRDKIENTIKKIGTGTGKEEYVEQVKGYSIRVDKGTRIIFDKGKKGEIILREYLTRHY